MLPVSLLMYGYIQQQSDGRWKDKSSSPPAGFRESDDNCQCIHLQA